MANRIWRTMRFCDDDPVPEVLATEKANRYYVNLQIAPATQGTPQQPTASGPYYPAYRSDPLAADRPGEELLPEASVWQIYKKEANDYDNELVKGRNENLDTMLIFAALFSAILATFLVESMSLLEEDQAEKSAALLLILVQSQLGVLNVSSAPLEEPSFMPTSAVRWVNGLWFAALALSLAAALLAMLAKEWLDSFITFHKRAPYAFAITRQARLDGFKRWRAAHIMDLLPTLLHISLLLFALGLIVRLWRLDRIIAIMLSMATCLTFLLYLGTIVCGAYFQLCPFVTQLSRYLQAGLRLNHEGSNGNFDEMKLDFGKLTTVADVRALAWLAKHARDGESSKSAYQALAGLRQQRMKGPPRPQSMREYRKWMEELRDATGFFKDFSLHFESTLVNSLVKHKGESAIRYVQALPDIATYMATFASELHQFSGAQTDIPDRMELVDMANTTLASIFGTLDLLWNGSHALTARTYAHSLASELRLTKVTVYVGITILDRLSKSQTLLNTATEQNSGVHVNMCSAQSSHKLQPDEILSRYPLLLASTAFLISRHIAPIRGIYLEPSELLDLIEALEDTAAFMLGLPSHYSKYLHGTGTTYQILCPNDIWTVESVVSAVLETLIKLVSAQHLDASPTVIYASARAIYTIAILHKKGLTGPNYTTPSLEELHDFDVKLHSSDDQVWTIKCVSRVAAFAMSHYPSFGLLEESMNLLLKILTFLRSITPEHSTQLDPCVSALQEEAGLLIQLAEKTMSSWPKSANGFLIKILAHILPNRPAGECQSIWGGASYFWSRNGTPGLLEPASALLNLIEETPGHSSEVVILLDDLAKQFNHSAGSDSDTGGIGGVVDNRYLRYFTGNLGFEQLAKIGRITEYALLVAQSVIKICTSSCLQERKAVDLSERLLAAFGRVDQEDIYMDQEGRDIFEEYQASPLVPYTQTLSPIAMPGFLVALSITLDHLQMGEADGTNDGNDSYFVECATKLLNVSIIASQGDFDEACGLKAGEVARRLCQYGAPQLEKEAAALIAQYDQDSELQTQTEEEIETLQVESVHSEIDEVGSANPRTPMLD